MVRALLAALLLTAPLGTGRTSAPGQSDTHDAVETGPGRLGSGNTATSPTPPTSPGSGVSPGVRG